MVSGNFLPILGMFLLAFSVIVASGVSTGQATAIAIVEERNDLAATDSNTYGLDSIEMTNNK